jgi:hypothetical protein
MKLSEIKKHLNAVPAVRFRLPSGNYIPPHFQLSEISMSSKRLMDCGGKVHIEKSISFQLWYADAPDHQHEPQELLTIIEQSEKALMLDDQEIEVEYQLETIGKYGLSFDGEDFLLTLMHANCRAKNNCGLPDKRKIKLGTPADSSPCSAPDQTCC